MLNRHRRATGPVDSSRTPGLLDRPVVHRLLFLLAALIVVQHLVAHAGLRPLPMSMGWQDVLVGYPAAVLVAMVALMLWGKNPVPR